MIRSRCSGHPAPSARRNFASWYLCLLPSAAVIAVRGNFPRETVDALGRLFRRQVSETSWQLASKGRLVIPRNASRQLIGQMWPSVGKLKASGDVPWPNEPAKGTIAPRTRRRQRANRLPFRDAGPRYCVWRLGDASDLIELS